jgi:hypothetical protein
MKCCVESCLCNDTEYWTGWIHTAEYHERWTEEWDEYIPEQSHTDDKGRTIVDSPAHWEHRISHHPPCWTMHGSNKEKYDIDQASYVHLCNSWGNNNITFAGPNYQQTSVGDGKVWTTRWNNKRDTMVTCTTAHSYQNRVQASKSIFKFKEFKPKQVKELGLVDYPEIKDVTAVPSILGDGGPTQAAADRWMAIRNAELGAAKQVRIWIVIYHNPDQQVALDQESYWCGGNKNEMVLCIGVDDKYNALWAYPFSWTPVEELKINVRQLVPLGKPLDLTPIAEKMGDMVETSWQRKHFKDFNYLTVEPPFWAIMTTFFLTLAVNIGISFWIVLSDFENPNIDTDHWAGQDFLAWANSKRRKFTPSRKKSPIYSYD